MALTVISIIIGFGLGTLFGIALENKRHILAVLTVFGTVGAVIWAVGSATILKWFYRPKINVDFYETDAPYLRYVPPEKISQSPLHVLTLCIENSGRSVAESCQPLITKLWFKETDNDFWVFPVGWVPLPLRWVFQLELQRKYVDERDIVPLKPYLFNLCSILETNKLELSSPIWSRSQSTTFSQLTTYCFEITVSSVNANIKKKYYYIEWKGAFERNLSSFANNIKIYESKEPPKSFRFKHIDDSQPQIDT